MPHENADESELGMRTRIAYSFGEILRPLRRSDDLIVQAKDWRTKRHPKWRTAMTLARENPILFTSGLVLALVFAPITIVIYSRQRNKPS